MILWRCPVGSGATPPPTSEPGSPRISPCWLCTPSFGSWVMIAADILAGRAGLWLRWPQRIETAADTLSGARPCPSYLWELVGGTGPQPGCVRPGHCGDLSRGSGGRGWAPRVGIVFKGSHELRGGPAGEEEAPLEGPAGAGRLGSVGPQDAQC